MSAEHDIRSALRAEADRYDPADDGWAGIDSGVGAARSRQRRLRGGVLGGLAAAGVALAVGLSAGGGDSDVDAGPGPVAATTEAPTSAPTTAEPTTTAPPTTAVPAVEAQAFPGIWPFASEEAIARDEDGDDRFEDPVATAEAFARDYVGMLDPVAEEVDLPGDTAGEDRAVELRPRGEDGQPVPDGGPRTTVLLRAYPTSSGVDVWTVTSASSGDLVLDTPEQGDVVGGGVLEVRGVGTGYEGHVRAEVRQDGMQLGRNLGEVIGITGSMGELGPLSLDVPFTAPSEPGGALVVTTDTGLDGVGVPAFTVVRIHFGEAVAGSVVDDGAGGVRCIAQQDLAGLDEGSMRVTIHQICDAAVASNTDLEADATFVEVTRVVPRSDGVLRASIEALLEGARPSEEGFASSFFDDDSALLLGVTLRDGTAVIDLDQRLTEVASGASTSAGSRLFRGQLGRTILQFPNVERIEYRLSGSCEAFWEWQQVGGCPVVERRDL